MAPFEVYPIKDASPSAMRRRKGLTSPRRPHIKPAQFARPDAHYALPNQLQRSDFLSQSPTRVASRLPKLPPPTDFEYVGSIEGSGWKPGHVPLFLEWYPENLDRRSVCKFFESGRKYTVGRSPACDFYFPNCEYDSGISGNHLTIKTTLVRGPINRIYVEVTDHSTNGTYVNNVRIPQNEGYKLSPGDHVTLLKRDNATDTRPNIGFRVVMALQIPKFDQYYTIPRNAALGQGAFGSVFKAKSLKTGDIVAVKIIRDTKGSSCSQAAEREIRMLRKLDHPNIVRFHDAFEETKEEYIYRYIVMDFIEGGTLHDWIRIAYPLSEFTVRHIIRQILSALEYMHDRHRVSHRDLKPANILVCNRGMYPIIKIADMGLAKIEASIRNTHCGTHGYLAPECTQGPQLPGLNWAMDIYAVGVTTYETLTGRLPFGNDENADPYERVLPMEPLLRRHCSEMVLDFLEWTLSMDPKDRPSAKESASHPWLLDEIDPRQSPRSQRTQPPRTIIVEDDTKTIRPTPPVAAPDSDSDSTRPSSSSSGGSSSASSPDSEDETLKLVLKSPKKNPTVRSTVSYVSDPMDICSVKSSPTRKRDSSTNQRFSNPMQLDTIRPADQVWCTLYPLKGNIVGKSILSLQKTTTTVGSSTEMDFVLRHPKVARHHCAIISQGWSNKSGNTGTIHIHGQKPVEFEHMSTIYLLKESEMEYIGYIVRFPAEAYDDVMTRAMNELNISTPRSAKRRAKHTFAPYTPSKRRCSNNSLQHQEKLSKSKYDLQCKNEETRDEVEPAESVAPWGVLIAQTNGFSDIPLTRNSTSIGNLSDFVDVWTGERDEMHWCRVYKLQRGEVGICAVKPVLVGEKRIDDGTKVLLENNETFTLCEEDMSHVSKYQIRIFKDSRSLRGN